MNAAHIVTPTSPHTHTCILLHGRGSTGPEFCSELFESTGTDGRTLPALLPGMKWIFPTAPKRYSTVFQEETHEWFDVYSLSDPEARGELQRAGLAESIQMVSEVLEREVAEIGGAGRVFLGGISMGCATAAHGLLAQGETLAGFVGVSGWLPFAGEVESVAAEAVAGELGGRLERFYGDLIGNGGVGEQSAEDFARKESHAIGTPALLCHGDDDDVVDVALGRSLRDAFVALGIRTVWNEYGDCGHWIKEPEGIDDLVQFMSAAA